MQKIKIYDILLLCLFYFFIQVVNISKEVNSKNVSLNYIKISILISVKSFVWINLKVFSFVKTITLINK